jgi:hypothetical protein
MPKTTEEIEFEHTLTPLTWYIVEVSFRKSNPIHRAIAFYRHSGCVDLMASYEGVIERPIESLAYFRVINAIDAMNIKDYPNRSKLPGDVEK